MKDIQVSKIAVDIVLLPSEEVMDKAIAANRTNSQELREQAIINKHCIGQILGLNPCEILGLQEIRVLAQ